MFNSLALLIKHQGWARSAKLLYLVQRHLIDGATKEEIMKESIDEHGLFQQRSFKNIWNLFSKIQSDISYYKKYKNMQ